MKRRDPRVRRHAGRTTHTEEFKHVLHEHNWIHGAQSGGEKRSGRWMLDSDTEETPGKITTMVVYLGVGQLAGNTDTAAEDPATRGQDKAHGGTTGVTEDA